jgi:hypothetical protein
MKPPCPVDGAQIAQAHALHGQLTGQRLSLGYDRERMWYELLRNGVTLQDLRQVIVYLQGEIRAQRRNVGALKLSNLLQPDRFEEDLAISRVRLAPPPSPPAPPPPRPPLDPPPPAELRQRRLAQLHQLKATLRSS